MTDVTLVGLLQAGGRGSPGKLLCCEFHQSEVEICLSLCVFLQQSDDMHITFYERNHGSIAHLFFSYRVQHLKIIPHPPFFTNVCDGLLSYSLEELFFQSVNTLEYALTSVHRK